jgi:serine/threonine protein kinase
MGELKLPDQLVAPENSGVVYFRKSTLLGTGGFSVCYLVEDTNGIRMAGKFFTKKSGVGYKLLSRFTREVSLMKHLDHPNLVKCYSTLSGVKDNLPITDFHPGDDVPFLHPPVMFLEYCPGGSLSTFLRGRHHDRTTKKYGTLSEREMLWVAKCVCQALVYLEEKRILHRDLKMSNLLLQQSPDPRTADSLDGCGLVLCDFGLATQLPEGHEYASGMNGTPYYMAREVVRRQGATYGSDIWSLGVMLFYCLTGRPPFYDAQGNTDELHQQIIYREYRWKKSEKERINKSLRHFIQRMLKKRPENRPTAGECLDEVERLRAK